MLNTIERQLEEWSDWAIAGIPADAIFADPDYDVYRRAFRLKRFFRCPHCDEKALASIDEWVHLGKYIWCQSCRWTVFVWDCIDLNPDDLILDIVRGVPSHAPFWRIEGWQRIPAQIISAC